MPEIRNLQQVEQSPVHIVSVSSDEVRPMQEAQNVVIYTGGIPQGGQAGDIIGKKSDIDYDTEWISPAEVVEQDNHNPVTSAAVYAEIRDYVSEMFSNGFIFDGGDASSIQGGD